YRAASPAAAPESAGPGADDTPRPRLRRQCRKARGAGQAKRVAGSIVKPEKEVDEAAAAVLIRQAVQAPVARMERVPAAQPQHQRRADRHAKAEPGAPQR